MKIKNHKSKILRLSFKNIFQNLFLGALGIFLFGISSSASAATITWDGGGSTNNWLEAANWSTDTVPGINDDVVFDSTSIKDSVWDAGGPAEIGNFTSNSSYTGTITMGRNVNINDDWNFGSIGLNSGTYKITFNDTAVPQTFTPGSVEYYDITLNKGHYDFIISGTAKVNNDLTIYGSPNGDFLSGTIEVKGDIYMMSTGWNSNGAGTIKILGTENQSLFGNTGNFPNIEIDKTNGELNVSNDIYIAGSWRVYAGSVNMGTSTLYFKEPVHATFIPGNVVYYKINYNKSSNYDLTLGGNLFISEELRIIWGDDFFVGSNMITTKDFVQTGGTISLQTGSLKITGDFTRTGGTFTAGTSVVSFQGTNQAVNVTGANTTFYKLYKLVNESDTLTITAGNTITIASGGVMRFWGKPEEKTLSIVSSSPGTPYNITRTGTAELEYTNWSDANWSVAQTAAASSLGTGNTNLSVTKEFICTIRATGGDYSALSTWEAAIQTDLTVATTKVFSHSGITGIIPDATVVVGETSGATGTAIHVTATQILIEDISGTFQTGEKVKVDDTNYITISDAGFGAIATAHPYNDWPSGLVNGITIDGWVTGTNNFVNIYVPRSERHNGTEHSGFYLKNTSVAIVLYENYSRVNGVEIDGSSTGTSGDGIIVGTWGSGAKPGNYSRVSNSLIHDFYFAGIKVGDYIYTKIFNNIIYDNRQGGMYYTYAGITYSSGASGFYVYNNTIYNTSSNYSMTSGMYLKNNLSIDGSNGSYNDFHFQGTPTVFKYNASSDSSATGTGSRTLVVPSFENKTGRDFHLTGVDKDVRDKGIDLSVDSDFPIIDDIDGDSRLGLGINGWDIGADEYIPVVAATFGSSTAEKHADPIAYWRFDEGYGATVHDESGNSNDGTATPGAGGTNITATAMWSLDGKYGKAMEFDGTDDYVNVGDLDTNMNTIAFWAKGDDVNDDYIDFDGGTHYVSLSSSSINAFGFSSPTVYIDGSQSASLPSDGLWHHIVITTETAIDVNNLTIGKIGANYFSGNLDEVKIFNYALTADDVKIEYNQNAAAVFGSTGTDTAGNVDNSTNREYCVPGDTATCNPPVLHLKMDEKQGMTAYDTSGNGNDGTFVNGPTWARGKEGGAVSFDGVDDYVDLSNLNLIDDITMEAWVYPEKDGSINGIIGNSQGYRLTWNNSSANNNYFQFFADKNPTWVPTFRYVNGLTGKTFSTKWYHVVGVRDKLAGTMKIYVDGNLEGITSGVPIDSVNNIDDWSVGKRDSNMNFKGIIDNVQVYNYARTPAQIAWDYNRGKAIAEWRFDECTGTTIHDESGSGNNGTITIGASGAQTSAGVCTTVSTATAWYNGRTGKYGKALSLDGTDDYASITQTSAINLTGKSEYALSAWVYADSDGENNLGEIIDKGANNYIRVKNESGDYLDIEANLDLATTDANVSVSSAIVKNSWNHIFLAYKDDADDEISVYVNGILKGTSSGGDGAPATDSNNLLIGGSSTANFDGMIDEVKIFNYVPTDAQIKAEYNKGAVSFGE